MGVKIEYKVGSRRVSQREWERHLREAPLEAVKDEILQKISRIRCPKHGQAARVEFAKTSQGFNANLSGCCDELMQRAQRVLQ